MTETAETLALGGGCHWCTEAVFLSLKGVCSVEQGWIASTGEEADFSEGIVVHYDPGLIAIADLVRVHLASHRSMSNHSMRHRYRSALYPRSHGESIVLEDILERLRPEFPEGIVTRILPFGAFRSSREQIINYYLKNPDKPFSTTYIEPKLREIRRRFPGLVS